MSKIACLCCLTFNFLSCSEFQAWSIHWRPKSRGLLIMSQNVLNNQINLPGLVTQCVVLVSFHWMKKQQGCVLHEQLHSKFLKGINFFDALTFWVSNTQTCCLWIPHWEMDADVLHGFCCSITIHTHVFNSLDLHSNLESLIHGSVCPNPCPFAFWFSEDWSGTKEVFFFYELFLLSCQISFFDKVGHPHSRSAWHKSLWWPAVLADACVSSLCTRKQVAVTKSWFAFFKFWACLESCFMSG